MYAIIIGILLILYIIGDLYVLTLIVRKCHQNEQARYRFLSTPIKVQEALQASFFFWWAFLMIIIITDYRIKSSKYKK